MDLKNLLCSASSIRPDKQQQRNRRGDPVIHRRAEPPVFMPRHLRGSEFIPAEGRIQHEPQHILRSPEEQIITTVRASRRQDQRPKTNAGRWNASAMNGTTQAWYPVIGRPLQKDRKSVV